MTAPDADGARLPALRPIDVIPIDDGDGDVQFVLQDMLQLAPHTLAVSVAGYFILAHLDGRQTRADLDAAFERQFGQTLPAEEVDDLIRQLDDALLLQTPRFEAAFADRRAAYSAADARDSRDRWPDHDGLKVELERLLTSGACTDATNIRGIVAPHLDYPRGGPCYADAYATLKQAGPADRYVILGVNHFGSCSATIATRKDFLTPLGRAKTDVAFIEQLSGAVGHDLCAHEFDHDREHSIELQVHLLQAAWPGHDFTIVPILCGNPAGPTGTKPPLEDGVDLAVFADALRGMLESDDGRRTMLICSADLSHIGQRFGDQQPTTEAFLDEVGVNDRALLTLLENHLEEQFVERVRATDNATRICSVGNLYTLLRALPDSHLRVLRYHQAVDTMTETNVTCAAGVMADES